MAGLPDHADFAWIFLILGRRRAGCKQRLLPDSQKLHAFLVCCYYPAVHAL